MIVLWEARPRKWNRWDKWLFTWWEKFWRRTALWEHEYRPIGSKWAHRRYEKMRCECWIERFVDRSILRNWNSQSCWCLNKEININRSTTHWDSKTKLYESWHNMTARCKNKNAPFYKNYWWRWIKCLWNCYEDFKADMQDDYNKHCEEFWVSDTVLDRINVDWNYCKENCRWVTRTESNGENCRHLWSYLYWVSTKQVSERCGLTRHRLSDKLYECWGDFNKLIEYLEKRFEKEWPFNRPPKN